MVEVRRTSARIKAEPGLKRRFSDALGTSTPPKPAKAAKTSTKSTPKTAPPKPEPVVEPEPEPLILPSKLTDSTPLPVLPEPQPDDLEEPEWQSIGDSGVFAASLARARLAIAKGTYFEKYWTKPVATKKQKDMTEEEKLQLKAAKGPTQSKVGQVKMINEPLAFDVQLLMIKDQHHGQRMGQLPPDKQHLIYGTTPRTTAPAYATPYRPPTQQPVHHPPPRQPAPITPGPSAAQPRVAPTPPQQPGPSQQSAPSYPRPAQTPSAPPRPTPPPAPRPTPPATSRPSAPSRPAGSAPKAQAPDPVIHALAQRASANPELKAIMKIVATGMASQQQLQYFQKHIDELTEMVKQRQEQEARARAPAVAAVPTPPRPSAARPAPPPASAPSPAPSTPAQTIPRPVQPPPPPQPLARPQPPPPTIVAPSPPLHRPSPTQYYHQPQPPAPSAPRPKMVTTATPLHILLQFAENPHERFLFPKHSILEFNATLTEVIVSFVAVKKGDDGKEYWAPVTLTFKGDAPTLSVLGRVVEPLEVARRGMEDVMVRAERAEEGFLAFRLPREERVVEVG